MRTAAVVVAVLMAGGAMAVPAPGCVERVLRDGAVVFDGAQGVRRLGGTARLGPDTAFRLASVSKQFTAAAVLALVADGRLSLDGRLADLLPGLPAYMGAITVRHLLTHTAGLPDYEVLMDAAAARGGPVYTPTHQIDDQAVLRLLAATSAPVFPSGARWAYSNSGYVVLGLLVAAVSGESFGHYLERRIFAPLGMHSTHLHVPGKDRIAQRAFGHEQISAGVFRVSDQSATSATGGDGGIYSTVADLTRWLRALDRGAALPGDSELAFQAVRLADGSATTWPTQADEDNLDPGGPVAYGFGWLLDPAFGLTRRWHFGTTQGCRAAIDWFPDRHVASIVLCNRMDLDARARALSNVQPFLGP